MGQTAAAAPKSSGLTILWDVIVAPKAAFAALREQPNWLWAFIAVSVLGAIGAVLLIPAGQHMMTSISAQMAQTDPRIAQMTPEQRQQMLAVQLTIQRFTWVFYPVLVMISALFTGLVMLVVNAISGGDGNFKRFFALAMNVAIVTWGIAYLLVGFISYLRGPDSFSSARDIYNIIPNLGWLVPNTSPKIGALLGSIGPFAIWSLILLSLGLQETSRIKPVWAWTGAIVIVFGSALIGAAFAQ
jgi:hypothetical protein